MDKTTSLEEHDRMLVRRQAKERFLAPLNIRTPNVPAELRMKWYGAPPTSAKTYSAPRRGEPISF